MGDNVSTWDTVLNDGICVYDLGKIYNVLKHLRGRCIVGPFKRFFHEGNLYSVNITGVSFILH